MGSLFERLGQPGKEHPEPDMVRKDPQPIIQQARSRSTPNEQMVRWLLQWPKPIVTKRDIQAYGPNCLRNPDGIPALAQTMVECGWLVPARAHRRDMKRWRIIREPSRAAQV
jgi:hypothetical protein